MREGCMTPEEEEHGGGDGKGGWAEDVRCCIAGAAKLAVVLAMMMGVQGGEMLVSTVEGCPEARKKGEAWWLRWG